MSSGGRQQKRRENQRCRQFFYKSEQINQG
jgi:hypothetical protein